MSERPRARFGIWPGGLDFKIMAAVVAVLWPFAAALRRLGRGRAVRHVLFVSERPRAREGKLALALRRHGWRVALICGQAPNLDGACFDTVTIVSSPLRAWLAAALARFELMHVFSLGADPTSALLVTCKLGPTIYDPVDVLEAQFGPDSAKRPQQRHLVRWQRRLIRRADGYCARDLQLLYARRHLGYPRPRRLIFFPDYCWPATGDGPRSGREDSFHLLFSGNFGRTAEGEEDWDIIRLVRRLAELGHKVTVFGHGLLRQETAGDLAVRYADLVEIGAVSRAVEMRRPERADRLQAAFRDFDAALICFDGHFFASRRRATNFDVHPFVLPSRAFDFIDAGLPILSVASFRLLRRVAGPAFFRATDLGRDDVRGALTAARTAAQTAARRERGATLEVGCHIGRLERFYARLAPPSAASR